MKKPKPANDNHLWDIVKITVITGALVWCLLVWTGVIFGVPKAFGEQLKKGDSGYYGYMKVCVMFGQKKICHGGGLDAPYTTRQECQYFINMMAEMVKYDMHRSFPELPMPTTETKCVKENAV